MISRIKTILDKEGLSASKFAEMIGVQRSSISHILSERNKPSLEFIQKILEAFPHINAEWILTGKGGYQKSKVSTDKKPEEKTENTPPPTPIVETTSSQILFQNIKKETKKKTSKIVTFYTDGTFDEHTPNN